MASIGGIASSSQGYGNAATERSQRMFAKVDKDGSGSVDATELQGLLDKVAKKTGQTFDSAETVLKSMDSDGNGSLNSDELDKGMKSLFQGQSTIAFAQGAGRDGPPAGGPPPMGPPPPGPHGDGDGDGSSSTDSGSTSTSSTAASTDPLDTNGDGTVSAQERAAGAAKEMLQALMKAADTDKSGALSSTEATSFKERLTTALSGTPSAADPTSGGTTATGTADQRASALASQVTALLSKAYGESQDLSGMAVSA